MVRPSPNKTLVTCAACGHTCNRDYSEWPPEGTPPENIHIAMGDRRISLFCTNPVCNVYNIYCTNSEEFDHLEEKYKGGKKRG